MTDETLRVRFKGDEYWWFRNPDGSGPLAPLDACDEDGYLTFSGFARDSYAHVFDNGEVKRYHKVIGMADEIEVIK